MNTTRFSLNGKRVLVTGAGSGIGKSAALMLGAAGAELALLGRTASELEAVREELGGTKDRHLVLEADVSKEEEMKRVADVIQERWNSLDGVVANAGINGVWAPIEDLKYAEWCQTFDVNMGGTFLTIQSSLPLLKRNGGAIVIVASINGTRIFSNSGATAYACSKASQVAFTKMAALELAKDHVRVNVIYPGAILTNIEDSTIKRNTDGLHLPVEFPEGDVPLTGGSAGAADDVAELIWFLLSDASGHISGTEVFVDGAQSLLQG